jgi:RHS repeat-associated protein
MGNYKMYYDTLGSLRADTSRSLYGLGYDYRNLLLVAYLPSIDPGKPLQRLTFAYDEASQRIMKCFRYYTYVDCGGGVEPEYMESGGGGEEESSLESNSASESIMSDDLSSDAVAGGDGGVVINSLPSDTCIEWQYSEEHYLYDGNMLLAIFNRQGNITQSYVNGPFGPVAVYWNNQDSSLYYFLKDHLGSTRVMVDWKGRVKRYIDYDPFGAVLDSWVSYNEPMTFTGKERDVHSTFDFYCFGSRYYDYRIGQFASVDKAGQFASGYLYGGNNPLSGIDKDGDFWTLLIPGLFNSFLAGLYQYKVNPNFHIGQLIGQTALGGAASYLSSAGNPTLGESVAKGGGLALASNGMNNLIAGEDFFSGGVLAAGTGTAFGILSSQEFKNYAAGRGFISDKGIELRRAYGHVQQHLNMEGLYASILPEFYSTWLSASLPYLMLSTTAGATFYLGVGGGASLYYSMGHLYIRGEVGLGAGATIKSGISHFGLAPSFSVGGISPNLGRGWPGLNLSFTPYIGGSVDIPFETIGSPNPVVYPSLTITNGIQFNTSITYTYRIF